MHLTPKAKEKFILTLFMLALLISLFLLTASFLLPYADLIHFIAKRYTIEESIVTKFLQESNYRDIRFLFIALTLVNIICLRHLRRIASFINKLFNIISTLAYDFFWSFKSQSPVTKFGIILLTIAAFMTRMIYAYNVPISYDEAFTYRVFASKGPLVSVSFYPFPNNHIFHSLLSSFFIHLPLPLIISLRLTAIIFFSLSVPLLFILVKNYTSQLIAFSITILYLLLPSVVYYSFTARGYSMSTFFFLLAYLGALGFITNKLTFEKFCVLYVLANILGFYTIPSFLYPFFTLAVLISIYLITNKYYTYLKKFIIACIVCITVVLIFYSPIIILNGYRALILNPDVAPIDRIQVIQSIQHYWQGVVYYLIPLRWFLTTEIILLAVVLLLINDKKQKKPSCFNLGIIIITLTLPVLHSVLPYSRVWMYMIPVFLLSIGLVMNAALKNLPPPVAFATLAALTVILGYNSFVESEKVVNNPLYKLNKELADVIIQRKPKNVYTQYNYIDTITSFYEDAKNLPNTHFYEDIGNPSCKSNLTGDQMNEYFQESSLAVNEFDMYIIPLDSKCLDMFKSSKELSSIYANTFVVIFRRETL